MALSDFTFVAKTVLGLVLGASCIAPCLTLFALARRPNRSVALGVHCVARIVFAFSGLLVVFGSRASTFIWAVLIAAIATDCVALAALRRARAAPRE